MGGAETKHEKGFSHRIIMCSYENLTCFIEWSAAPAGVMLLAAYCCRGLSPPGWAGFVRQYCLVQHHVFLVQSVQKITALSPAAKPEHSAGAFETLLLPIHWIMVQRHCLTCLHMLQGFCQASTFGAMKLQQSAAVVSQT